MVRILVHILVQIISFLVKRMSRFSKNSYQQCESANYNFTKKVKNLIKKWFLSHVFHFPKAMLIGSQYV